MRPGLATDLHFVLLANRQAHQTDEAVARCRLAGEMQLRLALEPLRRLADQRRRARMQTAAMGNLHVTENFRAAEFFCIRRCTVTSDDVQQRLADLHRFQGDGARLKILAVGQDQQADQAFALAADLVQVIAQQRLAIADPRAFLDQHREAFALQLHRVQTKVQQQLGAVVGAHGQRMAGAGDVDHHPGAGRIQGVVQRIDGNAVAHRAAGEHRVRNVGEREHWAAERGA